MQKTALSISLAAIAFACCLTQVSAQCQGINPYIATAFDAINFKFSTGYHDMDYFRSLFVEENGNWRLFDFVSGRITTVENGQCSYYTNPNLILDMSLMNVDWTIDFYGTQGMGYTIPQGDVRVSGVLDLSKCIELFTFIGVNNKPYTIIMRENVRADNVDAEIRTAVDPAVDYINTASCTYVNLPY